jgi:hypothetical protein
MDVVERMDDAFAALMGGKWKQWFRIPPLCSIMRTVKEKARLRLSGRFLNPQG